MDLIERPVPLSSSPSIPRQKVSTLICVDGQDPGV